MTVTSTPTTALPGDICPAWCGGEHSVDRDGPPEDHGVRHHSPVVDRWVAEDGREEIIVRVVGYRHDFGVSQRWADTVQVSGEVNPGSIDGVDLYLADARRLSKAIALACDLLEGRA
jgi:hypothetical protein